MVDDEVRRAARLRRLGEELEEVGFPQEIARPVVLEEIDIALRPPVHERRIPSLGTIIDPTTDNDTWSTGTQLGIVEKATGAQPLPTVRRFADGLSSWVLRRDGGPTSFLVFDRPAGSERDLVVLADVLGATIVQRHPSGPVRVVGTFGVFRWDRLSWHHEPPVDSWIDAMTACPEHGDPEVLHALLSFAVHDLGSRGIGALLIYRPDDTPGPPVEARLPVPPTLDILRPMALAPLRHGLAQVDGAALFDAGGTLRELGVRLVPSADAEETVEGLRGMRHTSARRYSFDDSRATVVVVSEDGPVTVLRNGKVLGSSLRPHLPDASH